MGGYLETKEHSKFQKGEIYQDSFQKLLKERKKKKGGRKGKQARVTESCLTAVQRDT